MKVAADHSTIVALATPKGQGGIAVIRVSGPNVTDIATAIIGSCPKPRYATLTDFLADDGTCIDQGLALYFPGPNSFTGDDVLELHGHGGSIVMDCLIRRVVGLGAQMARPGEFSERAFLNGKIDLAQAESIADLIAANSEQAAKSAISSLQGVFSKQVNQVLDQLIKLRMYVEAAIDFPDEEIDFLADEKVTDQIKMLQKKLQELLAGATQGALLRDGVQVALVGQPNAGKSSLLNRLSGEEHAIVTDIPGTTRDLIRTDIVLEGLPLHLIDTAGLRESQDTIEREGIRRAKQAVATADLLIKIIDISQDQDWQQTAKQLDTELAAQRPKKTITVLNKSDLLKEDLAKEHDNVVLCSAKTGAGIEQLTAQINKQVGYGGYQEGTFIARRRHIVALEQTLDEINAGKKMLIDRQAGELLAEHLRQAQQLLSTVTGAYTPDDLLAVIFSEFCIGK